MENKVDFETRLKRLEQIVKEMETSTVSLDKNLVLFEEGVVLIKDLESELQSAKLKVEEALKSDKK